MRTVLTVVCLPCLLAFSPSLLAQSTSNGRTGGVPFTPATTANAPARRSSLADAKTAFLLAEPALDAKLDADVHALRNGLNRWSRFDIVDRSDRADVTMTITQIEREEVAVASGVPIGAVLVNPSTATVRRRVVRLTIRQRSTDDILWRGESGSVANLLQRLQRDMRGPAVCIVFWCS